MLRRTFAFALGAAALTGSTLPAVVQGADDAAGTLAEVESRSGGRVGVYARAMRGGRTIEYRADERFPMCSTFKVLAVAAVLQRVDQRREHLERPIFFGKADLQAYAPVATGHVAQGRLTVAALCAAALMVSDNTAANLLLRTLGGPAGVTEFVRARPLSDAVTRLDRSEPALNTARPGDVRDTTTPAHMARDLAILLTPGAVLSPASTRMLEHWMHGCKTGTTALRAGAPPGWYAGDKTGSGENGTRNDVAIFRPPHHAPIIVTAYLTQAHALDDGARNAVLADVGRFVVTALA